MHLAEWTNSAKPVRIRRLESETKPQKILHVSAHVLIVLSEDATLSAYDRKTLELCWSSQYSETTNADLGRSIAYGDLLVIPAVPPQFVHASTGRILGKISEDLYRYATPINVDPHQLLVRDTSGYLGSFVVSGHLSGMTSNP